MGRAARCGLRRRPSRRLTPDPSTALAIVPLRTGKTMLGALAAATAASDGSAFLAHRLPVLESFAAVASALLAPGILARQQQGALRWELEEILATEAFTPAYQPIVELETGAVVGYEALTRFSDGTRPDRRFADAAAVGLGFELEVATLQAALAGAEALPPDRWLSLNVSPGLLLEASRLRRLVRKRERPLVLEVTEHVAIDDYAAFRASVGSLGPRLRFAVDDAGAGYSSFRHILELRPKLREARHRARPSDRPRRGPQGARRRDRLLRPPERLPSLSRRGSRMTPSASCSRTSGWSSVRATARTARSIDRVATVATPSTRGQRGSPAATRPARRANRPRRGSARLDRPAE